MTKRERFLAFANFEPLDRIPRRASYVPALLDKMTAWLGETPETRYEMDSGVSVGLRPPEGYKPPDYSCYFPEYADNPDFSIDSNGCGRLKSGLYHFDGYISPLRNATSFEEIAQFPYPDRVGWRADHMPGAAATAHSNGDFTWLFAGHIYENAWQVRGYEPFLIDLLTQRDWAEYILDRFTENSLAIAEAAARAGFDCIQTGDDVANQRAMMFEPELWREVMKPRWARVIAAARAIKPDIHVWYHSDGNIWDILDDLVEIGITILNPVQPECMNPLDVRKRMGKNLAFDGCIGTQTTFPFGTPQEMESTIRQLAYELDGLNGGLMLSPTHVLEPEVPPANIHAFFETCDSLVRE